SAVEASQSRVTADPERAIGRLCERRDVRRRSVLSDERAMVELPKRYVGTVRPRPAAERHEHSGQPDERAWAKASQEFPEQTSVTAYPGDGAGQSPKSGTPRYQTVGYAGSCRWRTLTTVQRLFFMFPTGLPGLALLLLRASVAIALLMETFSQHGV